MSVLNKRTERIPMDIAMLAELKLFKIKNFRDTILFLGQIDYEKFKKHGSATACKVIISQFPFPLV